MKMLFNLKLTVKHMFFTPSLREGVKYYFADFVRKGGGGTPQICNLFLDQNQVFFEQKTPFLALFEETDKICKVVFDGPPGGPPPLTEFFWQKRSYRFGEYPPPPVYGFFPKNLSFFAKNCVFCSKNT